MSEAWANGPGRGELMAHIEADGPRIERATDRWLTTIGGGERYITVTINPGLIAKVRRNALQLRIPDGPKRPDSFYKRVAELYSALAANGSRRPASEIAEANDIQVTTVHRWIKEARRRDLLGSGRKGKAG
jgi:hypothetical protein